MFIKLVSMNGTKSIVYKATKQKLIKWIGEEIKRTKYTPKQIKALFYLANKNKTQEILKIIAKVHNVPLEMPCCYCQKETNTWQEKMNKAQMLLELAEREGNEAEKLRIKETVHLLTQQFKQQHE